MLSLLPWSPESEFSPRTNHTQGWHWHCDCYVFPICRMMNWGKHLVRWMEKFHKFNLPSPAAILSQPCCLTPISFKSLSPFVGRSRFVAGHNVSFVRSIALVPRRYNSNYDITIFKITIQNRLDTRFIATGTTPSEFTVVWATIPRF